MVPDASRAITAIRKVPTATQTAPPSRTITTRSKAAPAYLAALDELDHSLRVYIDVCPFCGIAPIYVISFTADCALPVNKDGWDTIDGTITTDNEAFAYAFRCSLHTAA